MSNIRDPQFGVKKDKDTLTTQDPAAVLYGVTSDNKWIPIKISDDGALAIGTSITLTAGDLEIGAVEIKNYDTDDRAYVSPNHEVLAQARLYDAAGNALTSTSGSLDVDVSNTTLAVTQSGAWTTGRTWTLAFGTDSVSAVQSGTWNINNITGTVSLPTGASTEATLLAVKTDLDKFTFTGNDLNVRINSGILPVTIDHTTSNILVYGNDGTNDQKLKTNASGELQVGITNATLAVTQSGIWSVGRTWTLASGTDSVSAVQSGTWNINNITGTVSLPTGAATEVTLAGIKTQTDKLTFASTRLLVDGSGVVQPVSGTVNVGNFPATQNVNVTNATLAVTQSGAWTVTSNIGTTGGLALDATLTGGTAKTRILDSTGTALTSSLVNTRQALDIHQADTSFIVSGLTAVGSIPSLNPVSVSGVDGGGLKRHILTDTSGKVQVNLNDNAGSPITLGQKTSANSVPVVIASDQSYTIPNVSNIAYFVANNKAFTFAIDLNAAAGGAANPMVLIRNPNGSGKTLWFYKFVGGCNVTNVSCEFDIYANPTVTAVGTAQTIVPVNVGGGGVSIALATTLPTVSANGADMVNYANGQNTASSGHLHDFPIAVQPNNAILVTANPNSNNRAVSITLMWVEA